MINFYRKLKKRYPNFFKIIFPIATRHFLMNLYKSLYKSLMNLYKSLYKSLMNFYKSVKYIIHNRAKIKNKLIFFRARLIGKLNNFNRNSILSKLYKKSSFQNIFGNIYLENYNVVKSYSRLITYLFNKNFLDLNIRRKRKDLVIVCAFTGRHQILSKIIQNTTYSKSPSISWVLVGSTNEDEKLILNLSKKYMVNGCVTSNLPLGAKWQTAIKLAGKLFTSKLFCISGSDDLLSESLVENIIKKNAATKNKYDLYGTYNWSVLDISKSNNQFFNSNYINPIMPLGAGRFYTQKYLKKVNYEIFDGSMNFHLDDRGFYDLLKNKGKLKIYDGSLNESRPLISIKGDWVSINAIEIFHTAKSINLIDKTFEFYDFLNSANDINLKKIIGTKKVINNFIFSYEDI